MFTLVIDQDMELLLNLMAQEADKSNIYWGTLRHHKLEATRETFYTAMNDNLKKVAWCNHIGCRGKDTSNCTHKT